MEPPSNLQLEIGHLQKKNQKERDVGLWQMALPMEIQKPGIPTAAWKSLAKNAWPFHRCVILHRIHCR